MALWIDLVDWVRREENELNLLIMMFFMVCLLGQSPARDREAVFPCDEV